MKKKLMEIFLMVNLRKANLVLGMQIIQTGTEIVSTQHKYVLPILERFDIQDAKSAPTLGVGQ